MSKLLNTQLDKYERNLRKIALLEAEQDTLKAVLVRELKELPAATLRELSSKKQHLHLDTLSSPDLSAEPTAAPFYRIFGLEDEGGVFDLYNMNGHVQSGTGKRLPHRVARFNDKQIAMEIHTYFTEKNYRNSPARLRASQIIVELASKETMHLIHDYDELCQIDINDYVYFDLLAVTVIERIMLMDSLERKHLFAQLDSSKIAQSLWYQMQREQY